jgi:hypothetical protein
LVFRRGFVEYFRLSGKAAVSCGAKLAALTPVRELYITPATSAQVVALCRRSWLESVSHLYLPDTRLNDAAARAMTTCPYLGRLAQLRLGGSSVSPDVAADFHRRFRATLR